MYILLCGGGTAGHVEPALAIAEILRARIPTLDIRFIGRTDGEENRRILASGYALQTLPMQGLTRRLGHRQLTALWKTACAFRRLRQQWKKDPPALVLGTGGYVCFAPIRAAASLGIPTVLHESNATVGLAVRLLCRRTDKLLVNLPINDKRIQKYTTVLRVGMPVRSDIGQISRHTARERLGIAADETLIVSFGGSLGAERMNEVCLRFMQEISAPSAHIHHIHGCGRRYYDALRAQYPALCRAGGRCRIEPYLDDMPTLLRGADVVICRSGASTVAEVCAAGVPTLFIPSPHVTANHQYKNAKVIADAGGCMLLQEADLTQKDFNETVKHMLTNTVTRARMRKVIHTFFDKNTDEKIYRALCVYLSSNSAQD